MKTNITIMRAENSFSILPGLEISWPPKDYKLLKNIRFGFALHLQWFRRIATIMFETRK